MTLFEELTWRGFVHQYTHEELVGSLAEKRFSLYCGFDPTADSLHIGSLLPIMGLVHFQRFGHKPVVLVGGGTGLIGDPSFKAQERSLLTKEQVTINVAGIRAQLEHFLGFEGDSAAVVVNNADWLCTTSLVDFLRDVGKHFSVNVMLARDSVKNRLNDRDHGMSFTEFSYSLLQGYDFLHLYRTHSCQLQIGGSDQWGNIISGTDLIRRSEDAPAYGLTFPLVLKCDGTKFGKSESGNVWLDPKRTSPYKFYQFWINQADSDVPRWLRYFTLYTPEEIVALEKALVEAPEKREAQRALAEDVTRRVHGQAALDGAVRASQALFGGDLSGLDDATLEDVFSEAPSSEIAADVPDADRALVDVLVEAGVFASKGEAKRLIQNGGLYVNNVRITAETVKFTRECMTTARMSVVRKGKKSYHLLKTV
jgi:tyrosyl-tRNA synthetase